MRWPLIAIVFTLVASGCKDQKTQPRTSVTEPAPPTAQKAVPKAPIPTPAVSAVLPDPTPAPKRAPSPRPWRVSPGPEVCADCHPDEVDGFEKTGMGRTLYPVGKHPPIEDFDPAKATVVHAATNVTYRAYIDEAGKWWQSESVEGTDYVKKLEVDYVVGSGNHTRSYIGELEGELVEMPLTWYVDKGIWDMSPGYNIKNQARFERRIQPACLFCHNDLSPIREETTAGFHAPLAMGMTCTRCHGDATEHVKIRMAGKGVAAGTADPTIVNPARLEPKRQLQVCQQCHLTGKMRVLHDGKTWDEFDVRTPLDSYMSIYVDADDKGPKFGIASHATRLSLSRCFQQSEGQLTCTKCHNPHQLDPTRSKHDACVGCHQPTDCGDEHGKTEGKDCARCHMPHKGTNDIPHVTFTDHFIRRKPEAGKATLGVESPSVNLVDALAPDDRSAAALLRLGIAHAELARLNKDVRHAHVGVPLLQRNLQQFPKHAEGWWQLGQTLASVHEYRGAIEAFKLVEAVKPNGALHRLDMATAYEALGQFKEAEALLKKAVKARPDYRKAWGNLANNYQRQDRFDEAEALYAKIEAAFPGVVATANNRGYNALQQQKWDVAGRWFKAALKRDGTDPMGHFNLGTLALKQNNEAKAHKHFRDALVRDPKFALAHWLLGRLALKDNDLAAARASFEAATEKQPENPIMYMDLAQTLFRQGHIEQARQGIFRGLAKSPGHPLLADALNRINAGQPPLRGAGEPPPGATNPP